jgi:cyclopropane fatty-acyl-phospholipid synthase-like methyltransferase
VNGELEYHERLYSGFAQQHFARPAVRALRAHMVRRMLRATGAGPTARVLSLGCGIGDTELLLARHVGEVVGVDFSPAAVAQARADAAAAGISNARFVTGAVADAPTGPYDAVVAVFFLHHLPEEELRALPSLLRGLLRPDGVFWALDPSRYRLSGAVGNLLIPGLMRKYQSPGERELARREIEDLFRDAGFGCRSRYYDFISSPLAGLLPGWAAGFRAARVLDEALIRTPGLQLLGSNFEIAAVSKS